MSNSDLSSFDSDVFTFNNVTRIINVYTTNLTKVGSYPLRISSVNLISNLTGGYIDFTVNVVLTDDDCIINATNKFTHAHVGNQNLYY
jgi:hypothetical protein